MTGFPKPFGKYELLERIGAGGMAEVFRARLVGLGGFEKTLVIKRILPELRARPKSVDMFLAEARLAALVQHKNVVQVFELGKTDEDELFIAMELVEGTDLRRILKTAGRKLRIPPWFGVYVMTEILDALSFAHALKDKDGRPRNIIHRDVTPSNIFISELGDIKLADFGVAKDDARGSLTLDGQLKGKIPYMSPEQLYHQPIDRRTDLFAAATVLWECLAQKRLFGGRPEIETMNLICKGVREPPSRHKSDVPPELDACVLRALEIDRDARYTDAQEFQSRLLEILPSLRARILPSDVRTTVDMLLGKNEAAAPGDRPVSSSELTPDSSSGDESSAFELRARASRYLDETREMLRSSPSIDIDVAEPVSYGAHRMDTSRPKYFGPHPFFVRGADTIATEPLDYFTALAVLKAGIENPRGGNPEISATQTTWYDVPTFVRLTGQGAVLRMATDDMPRHVAIAGNLESTSVASMFGRLWRDRATGRLIMSNESGGRKTHRELHLVDGRPTFAYSSSLKLQTPEYLIASRLITEDQIPELVRLSLIEQRPIEEIAAQLKSIDIRQLRGGLMLERLGDVFSWTSGQLIFDTAPLESRPPMEETLLALLPALVERAVGVPRLRNLLAQHLDKPLVRSKRFARGTRDMLLSPEALRTVQRLGSGEPLISLIRDEPYLERVHLVTAYAFIESELLLPPP
jgi:serine/threonine-protein kinase